MKIVVYTLPYEVANEAKKINNLFKEGLDELHLRKPSLNRKAYKSLIEEIESQYHGKIVLHDYFDLVSKYKLKGIHVNQYFFNGFIGQFRYLKYKRLALNSISTSVKEPSGLKQLNPIFSTIFIGPLFKKYSETSRNVNFDAFRLKTAIKSSLIPVFALGGINLQDQETLFAMGFSGIVLQSGIWKSDCTLNTFSAFKLQLSEKEGIKNNSWGLGINLS
jgi:thiamine-phosphate pyrophosphorylase